MADLKVSVLDYGAVRDSDAVQTAAFQAAIDKCFLAGGGEVVVPAGTYVIGDIRLRSNITLHLLENAVLLGSTEPRDYLNIFHDKLEPLPEEQLSRTLWVRPRVWMAMGGGFKKHLYTVGSYWNYGLVRAAYAENIAVIGEPGSRIDGRNVFDRDGEENYRGPHGFNMHFCKNLRFEGYTVQNTGNWAHAIFQSENVTFRGLTVLAGHDALHTRACTNVEITDCKLITGDDCVAGFDNIHVRIKNCEISSACSAFRYGGYDILIEDCNIYGPCPYQFRGNFLREEKEASAEVSVRARRNMLSCLTNFVTDDLPVRHAPGKILMRNCTVKNADRLFHMNLSGNESWQRGNPPTDVTFENMTVEGCKMGLTAYGTTEVPFRLTLKNVDYSCAEEHAEFPFVRGAHFEEIKLENVKISGYVRDELVRSWSDGGKVVAENTDIGALTPIMKATEDFVCKPI